MKTTARRAVSWTLLALVALGWWAFLRPSSLGGPVTFITVTGSSMEPGMHTDDLAVMYRKDSYQVGDVVAFRATPEGGRTGNGAFVIHRIKGGSAADGFVTRGDNNDWDDPWAPTADEVAGEMVLHLPGYGVATRWLAQPAHFAAVMAGLFAAAVVGGPRDTRREPTRIEELQP